jgi:hypothetical protein
MHPNGCSMSRQSRCARLRRPVHADRRFLYRSETFTAYPRGESLAFVIPEE